MSADDDVIGYVATGEVRPPRKGELWLAEDGDAVLARHDYGENDSQRILRPILRDSVVIEPGMVAHLRQFLAGAGVDPKDPALLSRLLAAIDAQTAPPQPVPAPCPECGSATVARHHAIRGCRIVCCYDVTCAVSGPWKPTEAAATESWNRFAKGGAK